MTIYKLFRILIIGVLAYTLVACSTTSSIKSNASIVSNNESDAATIYLMRPEPIRTRGIADNDIRIEIDEQLAAQLSAGEYIAIKVKPGKHKLTIRSQTYITSKPMPEEVLREAELNFYAGEVYMIHAKFTQEEFRGIYFSPREITLSEAKSFVSRLKPHGPLAKSVPIEAL